MKNPNLFEKMAARKFLEEKLKANPCQIHGTRMSFKIGPSPRRLICLAVEGTLVGFFPAKELPRLNRRALRKYASQITDRIVTVIEKESYYAWQLKESYRFCEDLVNSMVAKRLTNLRTAHWTRFRAEVAPKWKD
jgi:hypothetical protein